MTEEQIALGRRAVACKGWRWMDGMKANNDPEYGSVVSSCWSSSTSIRMPDWRMDEVMSGRWLPDLADPATLGCMLTLVREAWGEPTMSAHFYDAEAWWEVLGYRRAPGKPADTEAEALVAALEAAP